MLKELFAPKKIILLLILAALSLFVFTQKNSLEDKVSWDFFDRTAPFTVDTISMEGSRTVVQPFTAEYSRINQVMLRFDNEDTTNAKGLVTVTIEDLDHNVIGQAPLEAKYILPDTMTKFIFSTDSALANSNKFTSTDHAVDMTQSITVTKGTEYNLIVSTDEIATEGQFTLHTISVDPGAAGKYPSEDLLSEGQSMENTRISGSLGYRYLNHKVVLFFYFLILLTALLIMIPMERIKKKTGERFDPEVWLSRLVFVLTPFVSYLIIAEVEGKTLMEFVTNLMTFKGMLNLFTIGLLWWLIYTICNRVKCTAIITTGIAFLFALTNYLLVLFRDSPLIFTDLGSFGTAMDVVGSYTVTFNRSILWSILFTVLWICFAVSLRGHKGLPLKIRLIPLLILVVWAGSFYYIFFKSSVIADHNLYVAGFKAKTTAKRHGYTIAFIVTIRNSIVEKPESYDPAVVERLAQKYTSDPQGKATSVTEKTPNIIIIMNESFSDLSALGEFDTNEDYMPFYHSLHENTIKGWMHPSIYGGSTANSEFECLTGFSLKYLPYRSTPYRSVVKSETPSLTYVLKCSGYGGNIAFHPGMRDSYARDTVYPLLGFDKHISLEDLKDPETLRDFVSDTEDYRIVENQYETFKKADSAAPFYMFNVTIQNHGGYSESKGVVDAGIQILEQEHDTEMAGQFVNLMKYSDDALRELLSYFEKQDEPTVIMLFGDHQPRLESEFYSSFDSQHKGMSDLEKEELKYRVPFMIWANYDIEEKNDIEISANYMSSYLLQTIGGSMTGYDKYLMEMYKKYPVVSAICCEDAEGRIFDPSQEQESAEELNELAIVQYNGLIDKKNRVDNFFELEGSETE